MWQDRLVTDTTTSIPDFSAIQHGTLPTGTVTDEGEILDVSDTAYLVQDGGGERWVAFRVIHGPYTVVRPLVLF